MKTYWDLSERERASLTIEQVEKYLDAELMTKGVLSVPPLELVPERERAAKMQRIAETFEKYKGIAGDGAVARKFLEQAFPTPVIAEAEEWFGRAFGAASEAAE